MQVHILVFDGFDDLDVIGVYEPLKMAGINVLLMSLMKQATVKSCHGIEITPHGTINIQNKPDLLIVPGGGWIARSAQGAWAESEKGTVLELLKEFHQAKVTLASVCAGAMLLAKAGLLNGRKATTHQNAMQELSEAGAKIITARVVDDGDIITASGITSSIDLGLFLINKFVNAETAKQISDRLEYKIQN